MNAVDLAALLRGHATRQSVPGAAVGVLCDGALTTAFHGIADVRTGEPVTAETRFAAGSLTKSMVATVIVRLADAGRLALDDPAAVHVPELRGVGWAERASVRDLMANRSGLPLRADLEFGFDAHPDTGDGALAGLVAELAAAAPTRLFWSYSNTGWCVLGRVIETASGTTWEAAMRRELFDAAGMIGTTFEQSPDASPRVAGHRVDQGRSTALQPTVSRAYGPAGTSVLTTVRDLLQFAAVHLTDPSLTELRVPHAEVVIRGWLDAWGLGWARFDWQGGGAWGWDGLIGGERCVLRLLPQHNAAVAVMTNGSTGRAMYQAMLADLMTPLGVTVPPRELNASPCAAGELSRFAGTYAWPDQRFEVVASESGLVISDSGREREARPLDDRSFVVYADDPDDPTITFGEFDADGRPRVIYDMLSALPRTDD